MNRNDLINEIMDSLGSECSREDAERVYEALRADDRIYYSNEFPEGLRIREDVDLLAVAADVLKSPSEIAKSAGLKSLTEAARMVEKPIQTLINWHRDEPALFHAVILGCAQIKSRQ